MLWPGVDAKRMMMPDGGALRPLKHVDVLSTNEEEPTLHGAGCVPYLVTVKLLRVLDGDRPAQLCHPLHLIWKYTEAWRYSTAISLEHPQTPTAPQIQIILNE